MTRRKALTVVLSVIGVFGLMFALFLISTPVPAVSHASYAWKPGCHCGSPPKVVKPTTTTTKPTTTTTTKPTTTTAKATTTTTKKATTATTAKATAAVAKKVATTTAKTAAAKTAGNSTKQTGSSTTSTSAGAKGKKKTAKAGLAVGAAAAAFTNPGGGGPSDGTGGTDGSGDGSQDPGASDPSAAAGDNADGSQVNATAGGPPHYYLSPVAIAFLLVYGVSFALYRTKRMRVTTHRKIWNVMLLATFLLCGLLGLVLAVGVTRNPPLELPTWLLVWHVETGIAMCFISLFHVGWHLKYYLAIVTGKRRNERTKRAPAVEKQRAARPQARRPLMPRTDAERMLAFQRRRTTRPESGQVVLRGGLPAWTDPLAD